MRVLLLFVALAMSGAPALSQAAENPRALYQALNAIRVDSSRTHYVREIVLRRDVVRVILTEGKLAFLERCDGKLVGAVFTGQGRVIAVPRDPVERRSLARYVGPPLLDLTFSRAYLRFTDDTAQELERSLSDGDVAAVNDPVFAREWEVAVGGLNPWHSLRVLTDWTSQNQLPYFYAGLQTNAYGPLDVMVDYRRDEQIGIGQPKWVGGVPDYDLWTSFSIADVAPHALAFEPVSYALETTIRPDLGLEGDALLEARAVRGGERMVEMELSRQLQVDSVTDEQGRSLVFFQNEELTHDEATRRGNDSLLVILREAPAADALLRLRVRYRGRVISDAGNGAFFVGARGSWYPNLGRFSNFATFDLSFRWPHNLELVANGKKISQRQEGEFRMGRWVSQAPVTLAGFNLGNYEQHNVQTDRFTVEVYANKRLEAAMVDHLQRNAGPAGVSMMVGRRQIIIPILPELSVPSPAAHLAELGKEVLDAIRFNESLSVPFPYERLAVAQIPGSFGQGWPGLLYLSTLSFLSPTAQARMGASRETQQQYLDLVPPHEVAHQWWGNLVGWPSYRDQWIHEGLANYLALMFADSRRPGNDLMRQWLETYRRRLALKESGSDTTLAEAGPVVFGQRLISSKSTAAYGAVVYGKGTWVMHMLRTMLRDEKAADPDARFSGLLRALAENHRYSGLTTEDFQIEIEKIMTPEMDLEGGRSMDWFFDQYVRGTEIPRYEVDYKVSKQGERFLVTGTVKQSNVNNIFVARVPLYAEVSRGKLARLGAVVTSGPETKFRFTTSVSPRKLVIDPNLTVLAYTE